MPASVLIAEDDRTQRSFVSAVLQNSLHLNPVPARNGQECLDILNDKNTDIALIILDLEMPIMHGIDTLEILTQKHPETPVIVLTGLSSTQSAVKAMKLGATDFLAKPASARHIIKSARHALKSSLRARHTSRQTDEKATFSDLIGHEGGLRSIIDIARKAAHSDIPVLITGETGVGKECFAQAIHNESPRAQAPFIAVNCGALPADLVESILFGHEKGAFTGATNQTSGKFREAEGGTILLDEIGELKLETQVKLLRVLQEKRIEPVGGHTSIPINVRVISATNRDLLQNVSAGTFREDLYFRINVLRTNIPPLRIRKQDIPALAHYFIKKFSNLENRAPKDITHDALVKLQNYDWPGNVRQLENMINRSIVLSTHPALEPKDFLFPMTHSENKDMEPEKNASVSILNHEGQTKTLKEIQNDIIKNALLYYDGNVTQAALALGISTSTIYRRFH